MEFICRFLVEKQQKRNKAGVTCKRVSESLEKRPNYCVSAAYMEIILAYLLDLTPHVTNKRRLRITAAPYQKNAGFIPGL